MQQSSAFVELAEKCQAIFKAQRAMMELIPESVDIAFLKEDHRSKPHIKSCLFVVEYSGHRVFCFWDHFIQMCASLLFI